MKKSIRTKLFIGISSLGIIFMIFSWILNTQYLEKYYLNQKSHLLLENAEKIDEIYTGDMEDIDFELEGIERSIGGYIHIVSARGEVKYNSFNGIASNQDRRRPVPIPPPREKLGSETKYVLTFHENKTLKTIFLTLIYRMDQGDILDMMIPLAAISQSVDIANDFFVFTGMGVILLGLIFAFVFSKAFTKPILELNTITKDMAKFDFSRKYKVKTKDEIGQLGININYLSEQLEVTLWELNEKNKKLMEDIEQERKIDEMRKEFISSVSHELKTPIALIQGYAEGLKVNVNEDEESKNSYCEVIMDEAQKMDKLVKDLLNLSLMESGHFKIEITPFNLSNLVDVIMDKYKPILQDKKILLYMEKESDIMVDGDYIRIEQVLTNYINNGINHSEGEKIIKINLITRNDKVRISVYNTGKWIPEKYIDNIWTSFYKIDKARTREYGGSGLGLSIVRSILDLHHNKYGVENVEGGVVFWFELDKIKKCL